MKHIWSMGVLAFGLCACVQDDVVSQPQAERISFAVEPCFGFCPDFNISIDAAGQGVFEGENFVVARGTHSFTVSPAELAAFRERLAPFKPVQSVSYGFDNCDGPLSTDAPSVKVTWHDGDGTTTQLDWYMGCRQPGLRERTEEIYRAWEELPIADLVGADEDRSTFGPS